MTDDTQTPCRHAPLPERTAPGGRSGTRANWTITSRRPGCDRAAPGRSVGGGAPRVHGRRPDRHWHVSVNGTVSEMVCCDDLISTPIALASVPSCAYVVPRIVSWWVGGPPLEKDSPRHVLSTTDPSAETHR